MRSQAHRNAYYQRARGSTVEVDNFIDLSAELGLVSEEDATACIDHCARLSYLLTRLMQIP